MEYANSLDKIDSNLFYLDFEDMSKDQMDEARDRYAPKFTLDLTDNDKKMFEELKKQGNDTSKVKKLKFMAKQDFQWRDNVDFEHFNIFAFSPDCKTLYFHKRVLVKK